MDCKCLAPLRRALRTPQYWRAEDSQGRDDLTVAPATGSDDVEPSH
jgi:hypothetical protein